MTEETTKILEGLKQFDPANDEHWTQDGAPKVGMLENITNMALNRRMIVEAAPDFSRDTAKQPVFEEGSDEPTEESTIEYPENMTEEQFAEFLKGVPRDDLREIEGMLDQQMVTAEAGVKTATDFVARIKRSTHAVRYRLKTEFPNSTEMEAIKEYIESQNMQRANKVAIRKQLLKGIDLKDLDHRSPIDAAMARKTARGGKRPNRNLMG